MDKTTAALIVLGILVVALGLMYLGWRARRRRQAGLPHPDAVPRDLGSEFYAGDGMHVATTTAGDKLDRIAVSGVGYRARAGVLVAERGVMLAIAGERDAFVPVDTIRGARRDTWTIDRAVETDGLVVITWTLGGTAVDTYLRVDDPDALLAAVHRITADGSGSETP
ncbi:hypothetical protein CLV46_1851 [Diaminobutyricimonas aerilata]|uniref:PH domain-containing protein n=1 Tax=Diaminobutyricimonas aerilata TaxID=1162967 RepID=A0A2M9CK74_9MICO|nr:hypothetical protein [Diaminobutyricimonas aerilata]PJJ72284.1 hypothetical protein CLV46_1851 [Diaminobutyricimonas aerilata]